MLGSPLCELCISFRLDQFWVAKHVGLELTGLSVCAGMKGVCHHCLASSGLALNTKEIALHHFFFLIHQLHRCKLLGIKDEMEFENIQFEV